MIENLEYNRKVRAAVGQLVDVLRLHDMPPSAELCHAMLILALQQMPLEHLVKEMPEIFAETLAVVVAAKLKEEEEVGVPE